MVELTMMEDGMDQSMEMVGEKKQSKTGKEKEKLEKDDQNSSRDSEERPPA